jgi:acyl-CoA synthetase (AMP-forming)/AMP-acid ligase II
MMNSNSEILCMGNLHTPPRVGIEHETAWSRWCRNAVERPNSDAIIHRTAGEAPFRWTFSTLVAAAEQYASCLMERGVRRGDVCAIILRHNSQLYPLYLGICAMGAIPAILAYPNPRLHPDKFRQGIEGMSRRSGLDWILTERELQPVLEPLVTGSGSTIRGLHFPLEWQAHSQGSQLLMEHPPQLTPTEPLLLQHSSGTTGLQKPVLLSHKAVLEHVKHYAEAISLTHSDKIVSWLPLYHDMGLIAAFHLPLIFGIPSIQIDPFQWVMAPSLLLEAITQERATVTWLPNFAFNMMASKIKDEDLHDIDLSSLRLIVNCSEPVRYESHESFLRRFQPYGLQATAFSVSYAMAETTFAVTQTPIGQAPTVLAVDRSSLAHGKVEPVTDGVPARVCVSSGKPVECCEVRIVDENRFDVVPGSVGEIAITSSTMFSGYRNYPEKTAEVLCDGWYYSGDYGFQNDGELFVIGRKKDIIIVAGNNIYPEDVEDAVGAVQGVIPGRVVAIGEDNLELGSEHVAVIAESSIMSEPSRKALRIEIIKAGMASGITIARVYLVPPRWLIKSSAGKPSRKGSREKLTIEMHRSEVWQG